MKSLLRVLFIIFVVTTSVSLAATVYQTIFRAVRRDWIITTAEITSIAPEDGIVFGSFTDYNGIVHTEHRMYSDGRFYKFLFFSAFSSQDTEPYLGTTVRIMYDPSTIAMEERSHSFTNEDGETVFRYRGIEIASYDNWLQSFIVSASVFGASMVLLAGVIIISVVRNRAAKRLEKT